MGDDHSDEHRRQGRADAVVRIVLSRTTPLVSAERWCEVLDLEREHVEEALIRLMPPGSFTNGPLPDDVLDRSDA